MKFSLAFVGCFVFATLVNGQGYGRSRTPVVHPKPIGAGPLMGGNPIGGIGGGVMGGALPPNIAKIIGSTVTGQHISGGMAGFPEHGGSGLDPSGLRDGFGADPNEAALMAAFNDPMNNPGAFPGGQFPGQQLVFDPVQDKYVRQHQQAKASQHMAVKSGGPVFGGPFKDDDDVHIIKKTVGGGVPGVGPFIDPVGQHVESKIAEQQIHNVAKSQGHNAIKSGAISAGKPIYMNQGLAIDHNINKAALGVDATIGHNIAKSSGAARTIGFINPKGVIAKEMHHNAIKSTGGMMGGAKVLDQFVPLSDLGVVHNIKKASGMGAGVGINPIVHQSGKMQHNIIKSNVGVGIGPGVGINPIAHESAKVQHGIIKSTGGVMPVGGPVIPPKNPNPVHSVHKVGKSGIASVGHDPLAANIGNAIAKQVISQSAHAVDIGSNGGVSAGNPLAIAASEELAGEALHVAGKALGVASQVNPIKPNGPIGIGKNIFGGVHPKPIHPKPIHAKPILPKPIQPKIPTGYGRRRY